MTITIMISLAAVLTIFVIVMLIGRYIQNRFSLLISNSFISYSIGFSAYIAALTILVMPIVFFAWPTFMLISVFWIFNIILVIFLLMNWKILNLKNISYKQISVMIILSVILLITTRFIVTIPNSGNEYFYAKWVKSNLDINHLNNGMSISKYHFGEGWYYFQTILLRTLGIDQNFLNYWTIGSIVNIFITSVITGFIFSVLKKRNFLVYASGIGIAIFIAWFSYNGETENIGNIPMTWNFILLLTLFINFISRPKIQYMYLIAVVSYAGWSFSSTQLFLSIAFLCSAVFLMLFKKSHLIIEFVIIFSYSIFIMLLIFLFNISYVAFSILFIVFIFSPIPALYILNHNTNECHEYSLILVKRRKVIFYSILVFLIGFSFIIWLSSGRDLWFSFKYDGSAIIPNLVKHKTIISIITYVCYWVSFIFLGFIIFRVFRKGINNDKITLLFIIAGFGIIFFFNPLVAPLWEKEFILLPKNEYHQMKILTILPLIISLPLLLNKIKMSYIIQGAITLSSFSLVFTVFGLHNFLVRNLSIYNGQAKGIEALANYINNNLSNKRMTGDTDGLEAYVNNDLSFAVFSKQFEEMRNDKLTDKLYSSIDNSKVDFIIKLKDNVGDFNNPNIYKKYKFNQPIYIGSYEIFDK